MKYKGMTVNERLYHSGQLDIYEKAVKEKNIGLIKKILKSVELNEDSILFILREKKLI